MPPDTLPEWSKGVDSSSTSASCVGSNPTGVTLLLRGLQPPSEAILPGQWTRPDGALLQPEVPATTAVLGRTAGCPRPCPCAEPCQQSDAAWRCCGSCRVRCFPKLCSGRVVILCCGRAWRKQRRKSCRPTLCPSGLRGWTQVPLARAAWAQIPQVSLSPPLGPRYQALPLHLLPEGCFTYYAALVSKRPPCRTVGDPHVPRGPPSSMFAASAGCQP